MRTEASAKEENWREMLERAQNGDMNARGQLVTENMGLVYMVVQRFGDRGAQRQDLVQIGAIGLLKAIDRFDKDTPYALSTYAVPLIMGEIRRFLRDDGMIHVSRRIREQAGELAKVREHMKNTQKREPTLQELSEMTGIGQEEMMLALSSHEVDSLSRPLASGDGRELTLEDQLEDAHRFETPLLNRLALSQAVAELAEPERKLIALRYRQGFSQSRTAELLGCNQVAVSRKEKKILEKLRRKLS